MMGYTVSPSVKGIVLSVSFSVFIGVFFGYYPANRAAKLDSDRGAALRING